MSMLENGRRSVAHAEKVNKAAADLQHKIQTNMSVQMNKDLKSQAQKDQNRRDLEAFNQRKRQEAAVAQRRVEMANKQQKDRERSIEETHMSKKQRVDDIRKHEALMLKQNQMRQQQILIEKARLQASIKKLKGHS